MDALVEKLDDDATQNFLIVNASHSKILEFRKQLKIRAIQAAKEKGIYLTESVGEKLGEAITINEPAEWSTTRYNSGENALISNVGMIQFDKSTSGGKQEMDFKKMKLRYEVAMVYALK